MGVLPRAEALNTIISRSTPISPQLPSDADTRKLAIIVVCAIAPVFTSGFVGLRLYAQKLVTRQVQIDDWTAVGTTLLCIAYSVLLALWTVNGGGMNPADLLRLSMFDDYHKWQLITSPFYLLACMGYKLTILSLYLRLFTSQRNTIYATWSLILLTIIYIGSHIITQIFGCRPVTYFWSSDLDPAAGSCINFVAADIAYGSLDLVTNSAIFALATPRIWASLRQRIVGATLVLLSGIVAFMTATVRFQYAVAADLSSPSDRAYVNGNTMIWMVLEINTGLICACTPTLEPLLHHWFPELTASDPTSSASTVNDPTEPNSLTARDNGTGAKRASTYSAGQRSSASRIKRTSVILRHRASSLLTPFKSPWYRQDPRRAKLFGLKSPCHGITKRGLAEGYHGRTSDYGSTSDSDGELHGPLTPSTLGASMKETMASVREDDDDEEGQAQERPALQLYTADGAQGPVTRLFHDGDSDKRASVKSRKHVRFGGDGSWFVTSPVDEEEKGARFELQRPPRKK